MVSIQWRQSINEGWKAINNSISSMRFGLRASVNNAKIMFLFISIYLIVSMLAYGGNYDFVYSIPFVGFFIKIINDFINTFYPDFKLDITPFFPSMLILLMSAEFIKISLIVSEDKKKLSRSDFYKIKFNLFDEIFPLFYFTITSIVYWSIFYLPFQLEIHYAIWYPILVAVAIYLVIRLLFYGYFIFDEEKAGPFKAFKMSYEITKGAFLHLFCFILVVLIIKYIFLIVIDLAIITCCTVLSPERSEADISQFTCMAPIISTLFIIPIVTIAQADIYRSLKAQIGPR